MGRVGVLLLNLGGPEQLKDVRPFLFNLFSDPDIVRLPFPCLQKPLAWLISALRTNKSQNNYRQIGGGSPLRKITEAQGKALAKKLVEYEQKIDIYVGMRYWHPFTEEAISHIKHDCPDKLVILPLYPQFSISTSGSSFRMLEKIWQNDPVLRQIEYTLIPSWYDNPNYLKSMADLIIKELNKCSNPEQVHIFFSAHGVPQSYVEEAGDPYQAEIEACTHLLMSTINRSNAYTLAYQSKVGPVEWLKPYAEDALQALGGQGIKDLLVVPISFVSEHIETLQEIDIEYREAAEKAGIYNFFRVPALNTHPVFIDALAELVIHSLEKPPVTFKCITHPRENIIIYPKKSWQWGITNTAEMWNGRLAMLGFIALLFELISKHGILHYLRIL